ncbi:MAG: NAD(+)/NADH kinase [Candidatus Aenigmarchaeota archaeon]|nr:NAD(+)/NADH kinase [Candidatus Aenigmarchaeota archaeon]
MAKAKKKTKILIIAKQNKLGIKLAKKLEGQLKAYTDEIYFDRSTALREGKKGTSVKKFDGDMIITVGGDGTLLWTAQQLEKSVPVLPVKIEGHGFLCTITYKELMKNIRRIFKKDYKIAERIRLKCAKGSLGLIDKIFHKEYPYALNEIVFARKRPSKILNIEFRIDGVPMSFIGDGLMFSTPSGSTAYNASAGGPIVDSDLGVISIIPLYPFYSNIKSFVVPAIKKVEVVVKNGECSLIIDGHGGDFIKPNTPFIVEKGEPLKIVYFDKENIYEKVKSEFFS